MSSTNEALFNGKNEELKKSVGAVREDLNGLGHDVAYLASKVTTEAKQRFSGIKEQAQIVSADAFEEVQAQVRAKPGLALGVATGVGVLIGLMAANRR